MQGQKFQVGIAPALNSLMVGATYTETKALMQARRRDVGADVGAEEEM